MLTQKTKLDSPPKIGARHSREYAGMCREIEDHDRFEAWTNLGTSSYDPIRVCALYTVSTDY